MKRIFALVVCILMSAYALSSQMCAAEGIITVKYLVDGESFTIQRYDPGKTIPLENVPSAPLEEDICFTGWYRNEELFDFENTVLTEELEPSGVIILEAKYKAKHGEFTEKVTREATCIQPGLKVKTCPDCGYREETTLELAAHQLFYVEEVESDCIYHGRAAHYECSVCGAAFRDESGGMEADEEQLQLPLAAHQLVEIPEVPSDCQVLGTRAHVQCSVCEKRFLNADETEAACTDDDLRLTEYGPHQLTPVGEIPSDCQTLGIREHFVCSLCQKRFLNEDGTGEIVSDDDLRLQEYGPHLMVPVGEILSDCQNLGTRAHYECSVCRKCYLDENGTGEDLTEEELQLTDYGAHQLIPVEEVPSDCQTLGIKAHYECSVCGKCFPTEEGTGEGLTEEELQMTEYGAHDLVAVPEIPSDCMTLGTRAHYVCSVCSRCFLNGDESGEVTSDEELRLPAYGNHILRLVPEHPASCTESGTKTYYVCAACGKQFEDSGGTKEIQNPETVAPLGHNLQKMEAVASTCLHAGRSEAYQCSRCEKLFRDPEGTAETTLEALALPLASHQLTAVPEKLASCTEAGNRLYYVCTDCKQLFADVYGTPAAEESVRIAALGHDYIAVEAEPAQSCLVSGHLKYYRCSRCGMLFDEEFQVIASIDEIAIPGQHLMALIPAVPADCTEDGSIEHYRCSACKRLFLDKEGTQEIFSTTVAAHHNLKKIEEKNPTCTETGNKAYFECKDCGLLFSDAKASAEIKESDITVAAVGHDFKNGICTRCGAAQESFIAQIIKGNNGTAYYGSSYSFTLNTDYETVKDRVVVKVNGWQLANSSFTVTQGSTVVTLTVDCIRSLAAGTYNITIETPQGTATGTFRVSTSPKTGDEGNVLLWLTAALTSAAGIGGLAAYSFKRKKEST